MKSDQGKRPPAAGPRKGRLPKEQRREQLLDVSVRLFASKGFEATSIEDIAVGAGVTRPILYDHFKSKDDIYLSCLRRARRDFEKRLEAAVNAANDAQSKFAAGFRQFFEFVQIDPSGWTVMFGGGAVLTGPIGKQAMKMRSVAALRIAKLIADTAPDADPSLLVPFTHFISGGGAYLAIWWLRNPEVSLDDIVQRYLAFAWYGLSELYPKAKPSNKFSR